MKNILSIDLGGTSAKVAFFQDGKITKRWQIDTDINNIWKNIFNNLEGLDLKEVELLGISMPGFIDHKNGVVKLAGNLNLKDYSPAEDIKKIIDVPTYIVNDANAATLGEFWKGAGAKYNSILLYTIGTGIGGGAIIENELVYGKDGYAGEFGHGGNFQDKYPCSCGLKHCLEPLSSATGITKLLKENGLDISVKEAGEIWSDQIQDIFKIALRPLASHMAIMQTAVNPDAIIIGGGPSNIGERLRKLIEDLVREEQLGFVADATEIVIAQTKNDAGVYGAAYWAITQNDKK